MIQDYEDKRIKGMKLSQLKTLVRNGEGDFIEFKLKPNHPEKIMKELVAFANTNGGQLLVGVDDDSTLRGLTFADEDEYVLIREIQTSIRPELNYTIERVKLENGKEIIIFTIKEHLNKPLYVISKEDASVQKAYVRVKDMSIQASKEQREIWKGQRKAKNLRFAFGEKEKALMTYLATNKYITVSKFAEIAQIPPKTASRTLVLLTLTNVLIFKPHEMEDHFVAA